MLYANTIHWLNGNEAAIPLESATVLRYTTCMHLQTPLPISLEALFIIKTMRSAGYDCYIVGGAVRDLILAAWSDPATGEEILPTDYDLTTDATPEQIQSLFPESFYENEFGTVAITRKHLWEQMGVAASAFAATQSTPTNTQDRVIDIASASNVHESLEESLERAARRTERTPAHQHQLFEITTYRSKEIYDKNFRKPDSLEWGESIQEDLTRRDFTINAMALSVDPDALESMLSTVLQADTASADMPTELEVEPTALELIDTHEGLLDLKEDLIQTVGDPSRRFQEDALRMLRAVRFSVQLNFSIDSATYDALSTHADLIREISWERIRDEFLKMLMSPFPKQAILMLDDTGLLDHILPELQAGKGMEQGGHHDTTVWVHALDAVNESPSTNPIVRLATLLHDIGKPETYAVRDGDITFYNHEVVGAHLAKDIGRRFSLSADQVDRLFLLVRHHMFYYQPEMSDAAIRRFMRNVGLENIDDILDLREADRLGSGAVKTSWRLEEMKQRMIEQLHQPMDTKDLAIDGNDLIHELGMEPGPEIGHVLQALLERVLEEPDFNERSSLLTFAESLL